MKVWMINILDSFTCKIVQHIAEKIEVVWNDRVDFAAMMITHIVISPGPSEAGASEDVIRRFAG